MAIAARVLLALGLFMIWSCTAQSAAPRPAQAVEPFADPVARGGYLVRLLSCSSCHTDGGLVGAPQADRWLAGSRIGIAWTTPTALDGVPVPGIVFPGNLTPDRDTGIGAWTDAELVTFLRTGTDRQGRQHVPVMPWPLFSALTGSDAEAVVAYLRSLTPVQHRVPDDVPAGTVSPHRYVHFGVYTWEPGARRYRQVQ